MNGFELEVDVDLHDDENEIQVLEERGRGSSEAHQGRIKLVAQPVSKSTVFDMRGEQDSTHPSESFLIYPYSCRLGGAYSTNARSTYGTDGAMLESASHVCHQGVPKKCYGWNAIKQRSNERCKPDLCILLSL